MDESALHFTEYTALYCLVRSFSGSSGIPDPELSALAERVQFYCENPPNTEHGGVNKLSMTRIIVAHGGPHARANVQLIPGHNTAQPWASSNTIQDQIQHNPGPNPTQSGNMVHCNPGQGINLHGAKYH